MTSKLAIRALSAIVLPGAFLAVAAPAASAMTLVGGPGVLSNADGSGAVDVAKTQAPAMPNTSEIMNNEGVRI